MKMNVLDKYFKDNDFVKYIDHENDRVVNIIFSSVDIRPGDFMFWKVAASLSGRKIFINDENNGWYVHGIPGLGGNVHESVEILSETLSYLKVDKVNLIGPSMGGYGAMLYGSLLKIRNSKIEFRCVSFGGEFVLYERQTRSLLLSRKDQKPDFADVRDYINRSGLSVCHIYGADDVVDVYQAHLASTCPTVSVYGLDKALHAVSPFLVRNDNLSNVIMTACDGQPSFRAARSYIHEVENLPECLYKNHIKVLDGDAAEAIKYLEELANNYKEYAIVQYEYGFCLSRLGRSSEALVAFKRSLYINSLNDQTHFQVGACYLNNKKYRIAISYLSRCISINERHLLARICLVEALQGAGRYFESLVHLSVLGENSKYQDKIDSLRAAVPEPIAATSSGGVSVDTDRVSCFANRLNRNDLTAEMLTAEVALVNARALGFEASQTAATAYASRDDFKHYAVAKYIESKWPSKVLGYTGQFDALSRLGLHLDARNAVLRGVDSVGVTPIMTYRLMRYYNAIRCWDLALGAFESDANALSDFRCVVEAVNACIFLRDFDRGNSLLLASSIDDGKKSHLMGKVLSASGSYSAAFKNISDKSDAQWRQYIYSDEANSIDKEACIWSLYRSGDRRVEFLALASAPLSHEGGYDLRVYFFRNLFWRHHPDNKEAIRNLARCQLHWRHYDEAHLLLKNSQSLFQGDDELYKMYLRSASIVEGLGGVSVAGAGRMLSSRDAQIYFDLYAANREQLSGCNIPSPTTGSVPAEYAHLLTQRTAQVSRPLTLMQKPKVAICVSGQLRALDTNEDYLVGGLLGRLNGDIFVDTWDTMPVSANNFRILSRILGPALCAKLPAYARNGRGFVARFPRTTAKLSSGRVCPLTEDMIREYFCPVAINIDDEREFDLKYKDFKSIYFLNNLNQAKMFYKIEHCFDMVKEYESKNRITYDVVVRCRTDIELDIDRIDSYIEDAACNRDRIYLNAAHGDGVSDLFAIGSREAMQIYSGIWSNIIASGKFDYGPSFKNLPAETLLGQHLQMSGVETRILPVRHMIMHADLPIETIDVSAEVRADAVEAGNPDDVREFVEAYLTWRAGRVGKLI